MVDKAAVPVVDFLASDFHENYQDIYREVTTRCPIVQSRTGDFYAVGRYDDIMRICLDTNRWSSKFGPGLYHQPPETPHALVNADPPQHDAEIRIIAKALSKPYFDSLEPDIHGFVHRTIDEMYSRGNADIHREIAETLPLFVICKMLGVPFEGNLHMFRDWVIHSAAANLLQPGTPAFEKAWEKINLLFQYFTPRIEEWRVRLKHGEADPNENLITRLLTARDGEGNGLAPDKVLGFAKFLLLAGSATTTILISSIVHRLLREPDKFARIHADPTLIPKAIEESLRVDSPVHGLFRTNNEPTVIDGVELPPDTKMMLLWASANRDPAVFPEPESFDLDRDIRQIRKHVAFGHGIHFCRGAPLARMEVAIALTAMFERLPGLRLDGEPVREWRIPVLQGWATMPVAWNVA